MNIGLQAKLGSIVVHVAEMLSRGGHAFDQAALSSLVTDPEVQEFVSELRKQALVPEMREAPNAE